MSQLARYRPFLRRAEYRDSDNLYVIGMGTRRNQPIREYRRDTHRLNRTARLGHVVDWVKDWVQRDGGTGTFIGFGRTDARTLNKARRLLPAGYESTLVLPKGVGVHPGQPTRQEQRDEYRLVVTLRRESTAGA